MCRKERRFQTQKNSKIRRCFDYRKLGKHIVEGEWPIAFKCYFMEEDDFIDTLIEKHQEKQKLIQFLEQEGSILTGAFKDKSQIFRIRNMTGSEMD